MTTTKQFHAATKKVNGWVVDNSGRTADLPWRCWTIDGDHALNNRQMSFRTREKAIAYAESH